MRIVCSMIKKVIRVFIMYINFYFCWYFNIFFKNIDFIWFKEIDFFFSRMDKDVIKSIKKDL